MAFLNVIYLLSLAFFVNGAALVEESQCPDICDCEYEFTFINMNCTFRELNDVPNGTYNYTYRLFLGDNELTALTDETFDGYATVRYLDLKRNKIERIETGTFSALDLYTLDLSDNLITTISDMEIRVNVLYLDRNPIIMEDNTPGPVPETSMSLVSLAECGFSKISKSFFSKFSGALSVNFSGNSIHDVTEVFKNLGDLGSLDLSRNNISEIQGADALAGPINLQYLILANNPLQNLDLESMKVIHMRGILDISETPLVCECQHKQVYFWAAKRAVILLANCDGFLFPCGLFPTQTCGAGPACVAPETCCDNGECSKNEKCAGVGLVAQSVAILLLLAGAAAVLGSKG